MQTSSIRTQVTRIFTLIIALLILIIAFHTTTLAAPNPNDDAHVRIIHAAIDTGNIDVFIDGKPALPNFTYGKLADYTKFTAGLHEIKVAPAGQGIHKAILTQKEAVEKGIFYTFALVGAKKGDLSLIAFQDENKLAQNERAKIRVYHLSPNTGEVNIISNGNTIIDHLDYKNVSEYVEVPANTYTFSVIPTTEDKSTTTVSSAATSPTATATSTTQTATPTSKSSGPSVVTPTPIAVTNAKLSAEVILKPGTVNGIFAIGLYHGDPALKVIGATMSALK